ncbi:hypothetical protein HK104_009570 [Borealophlyctis nickersoniae]|nr:hypothetical protein HK104_009570 [Borealophlyctis nickersoniae]
MHDVHTKSAQESAECATLIETQVIPKLRSLTAEIRKKAVDAEKEFASLDKELARDRDTYAKLTNLLRASLGRHQSLLMGDGAQPETTVKEALKDPWLACNALKRHISQCIERQESYRAALIEQQTHFAAFENSVLDTLRTTLSAFVDCRASDLVAETACMKLLQARIASLDAKHDWDMFHYHHANRLIERSTPLIGPKDLEVDGTNDPLTWTAKEGKLLRRGGGFRRTWRECTVVITAAGYFHVLPPVQIAEEDGEKKSDLYPETPELSLYLPDCVIGPLMMNEKEPEEFILQDKAGGLFNRPVSHKLKGASLDDSAYWWEILSRRVRTTLNRNDLSLQTGSVSGGPSDPSPQPAGNSHPMRRQSLLSLSKEPSASNRNSLPPPSAAAAPVAAGVAPSVLPASTPEPHPISKPGPVLPTKSASPVPQEQVEEEVPEQSSANHTDPSIAPSHDITLAATPVPAADFSSPWDAFVDPSTVLAEFVSTPVRSTGMLDDHEDFTGAAWD